MSTETAITYAFVGGEVSPDFYGRTDLDKFPLGLKKATNFFIDYRGAAVTRPGYKFAAPIAGEDTSHRLFTFSSPNEDIVLIFTDQKIEFYTDGGLILSDNETTVTTIVVSGGTIVVTAPGHTSVVGDKVFLNSGFGSEQLKNVYLLVSGVSGDDLTLTYVNGSDILPANLTVTGSATITSVYSVVTTIDENKVTNIDLQQDKSRVIITSVAFQRKVLTYFNNTNWTIEDISPLNELEAPTNLVVTPSGSGSAEYVFAVSAIVDGQEGPVSTPVVVTGSVNYQVTAGSVKLTWNPVQRAERYNIYRSLISPTANTVTGGELLGFVGQSNVVQFTDNNIIADFTKNPLTRYDPFAPGAVTDLYLTAASATGFTDGQDITINELQVGATGTGFLAKTVVDNNGRIIGANIVNPGSGYDLQNDFSEFIGWIASSYRIAIDGVEFGPLENVYNFISNPLDTIFPKTYTRFQQRDVYAGSVAFPATLWATSPGTTNNFTQNVVVNAGDGYVFEIDNEVLRPIRHMLSLRSGLLLFTDNGISLLRAEEGRAVSAVNAVNEPQAFVGASEAKPIKIGLDVLFVENKSSSIFAMEYTEYTNAFKLQDVSVLFSHLVSEGKSITNMSWASAPHKLIHCLREDGKLLNVTYERPNAVFAASTYETAGLFKQSVVAAMDKIDTNVVSVEREMSYGRITFLEVATKRDQMFIEDNFCVDCGLTYPSTIINFSMTVTESLGDGVSLTTDASAISQLNVGDTLFFGGAKATVVSIDSTTTATINYLRPMQSVYPQTEPPIPTVIDAGDWEYVTPVSVVSGLGHLEGATVNVLADGDVYENLVVSGGELTLDREYSRIHVGLPYKCTMTTLPPTFVQQLVEGDRKKIPEITIHLKQSRGLHIGHENDTLRELKNRTNEDWGEQIRGMNDRFAFALNTGWDYEQRITIEQPYPLPATVLSLTIETLIGDD